MGGYYLFYQRFNTLTITALAGIVALTLIAATANQSVFQIKNDHGLITFNATGSGNLSMSGSLALKGYNCSTKANLGKLTATSTGSVVCADDIGGVASGTVIGTKVYGGTAGSALFVGDTGLLAQDNNNYYWDDTNNYLGIGTSAPQYRLHVVDTTPDPSSPGTTVAHFEGGGGNRWINIALDQGGDTAYFAWNGFNSELQIISGGATNFYNASIDSLMLDASGNVVVDPDCAGTSAGFNDHGLEIGTTTVGITSDCAGGSTNPGGLDFWTSNGIKNLSLDLAGNTIVDPTGLGDGTIGGIHLGFGYGGDGIAVSVNNTMSFTVKGNQVINLGHNGIITLNSDYNSCGVLTTDGSNNILCSSAPGITIGSTPIASGASNRILFQNGSFVVSQSAALTFTTTGNLFRVSGTMSGNLVKGNTLASSGTLVVKKGIGTATGNILVIDSKGLVYDATNKRVGILTTTPKAALDVVGTISGTILKIGQASITNRGNLLLSGSGTTTTTPSIYLNNSLTQNPVFKWNATNAATGMSFYSGTTEILRLQDNGFVYAAKLGTLGGMNLNDFYLQRGVNARVAFGTAAGVTVDDPSNFSGYTSILEADSGVSTVPVLVLKGAASMTANLTEWQNSSSTVLSSMTQSGWLALGKATKAKAQLDVAGTMSGKGLTVGGTTAVVNKILTATATIDFASLLSVGCEDQTVTVAGAALSDVVSLGIPNASIVANGNFFSWVSAANTVSVRFCTVVSGDPASGSFRIEVHNLSP